MLWVSLCLTGNAIFPRRDQGDFFAIFGETFNSISGRFFAILFFLFGRGQVRGDAEETDWLSLGYISFVHCLSLSC